MNKDFNKLRQQVKRKYLTVDSKLFGGYHVHMHVDDFFTTDSGYTLRGRAFGWDGSSDEPKRAFSDELIDFEFDDIENATDFIENRCVEISEEEFKRFAFEANYKGAEFIVDCAIDFMKEESKLYSNVR